MMRRHGWQRPLHPLQILGASVFSFLVACFYCFLGLFLGSSVAEIIVTTVFSFVVTLLINQDAHITGSKGSSSLLSNCLHNSVQALSAALLFIRCTSIDPTDRTRLRKKKKKSNFEGLSHLSYGFILWKIVLRFFARLERKILRTCIRRKYLDPWKTTGLQLEPLLPFPLVLKEDVSVAPDPIQEEDMSFCSLCNFEVKKHSKHCRTCNRCVEGFDHHCRWLNNCIGKKNYTTFILLMIFVLIMLIIEGGTSVAIFVRCFADRKGIEQEVKRRLHAKFPREALATISVLLILMTSYSSAALGQLFFFHVVLIRKGMRTYDYILALREENHSIETDEYGDSDFSSDESIESNSPTKPSSFVSKFMCKEGRLNQNPQRLSIRIDGEPDLSALNKKQGFRASIDPFKLINMSREKALLAASKARDRFMNQKAVGGVHDSLKPLPLETKSGPLMKQDKDIASSETGLTPSKGKVPVSTRRFSSPRRRLSCSPTVSPGTGTISKHQYRSNFDPKLTQISAELETYISRQVLHSILKKDRS